jgi:hypothetical protein
MQNANDDLQVRWWKLLEKFRDKFGKNPDVEAVLFLIGIQEVRNVGKQFTKEQKQDLMHVAVCSVLSLSGYYKITDYDQEGWPHFIQLKELPKYNLIDQENFLKDHILLYFDEMDHAAADSAP